MVKTRSELGMFWDGEDAEGILVYGFWGGNIELQPAFPEQLWPGDVKVEPWRLFGEGWTVWQWTLRLFSWPKSEDWVGTVTQTLEALGAAGAAVSWCGMEGRFADPPSLFDPMEMHDGVWACWSKGGICRPPPPLDGELSYAPNEILIRLRAEVQDVLAAVAGTADDGVPS